MIKRCAFCNDKIGVIKDRALGFCCNDHRSKFWAAKEKAEYKSTPHRPKKPRNGRNYRWVWNDRWNNWIQEYNNVVVGDPQAPVAI